MHFNLSAVQCYQILSIPHSIFLLLSHPLPTHTPQIPPHVSISSLKSCKCLMLLNPTGAEVSGWAVYTLELNFWIKAGSWNHSQIFPALRETPQCMAVSWKSTLILQCCKPCFSFKITFFSCEILIVNGTSFWVMVCGREWLAIILLDFIFFMLLWEKRKGNSTFSISTTSQPIFLCWWTWNDHWNPEMA